jgi:hypothetical protein
MFIDRRPIARAGDYVIARHSFPSTGVMSGDLGMLLDDLVEGLDANVDFGEGRFISAGVSSLAPAPGVTPSTYVWLETGRDPYGVWTCENGRQVIFNRSYKPCFERDGEGKPARLARFGEWVPWVSVDHFWDDGSHPRRSAETVALCQKILRDWGVDDDMRFALEGVNSSAAAINRQRRNDYGPAKERAVFVA